MRACQGEYDDLLARQAEETHELLETVTAMISLGQGWSMPAVAGAPPWLASIRKHRFRPSRKLTELQATVAKLGEIGETTGGRSNARHEAAVEAFAAQVEAHAGREEGLRAVRQRAWDALAARVLAWSRRSLPAALATWRVANFERRR